MARPSIVACASLACAIFSVGAKGAPGPLAEALRTADKVEILVARPDLESPVRISEKTLGGVACHIELRRGTQAMSAFSQALSAEPIQYEMRENDGGDLRVGVIIWRGNHIIKRIYSTDVAGSDGGMIAVVDGGNATISSNFPEVVGRYFRSYAGAKVPALGSAPTCQTL